jgi:hypothetical protein
MEGNAGGRGFACAKQNKALSAKGLGAIGLFSAHG